MRAAVIDVTISARPYPAIDCSSQRPAGDMPWKLFCSTLSHSSECGLDTQPPELSSQFSTHSSQLAASEHTVESPPELCDINENASEYIPDFTSDLVLPDGWHCWEDGLIFAPHSAGKIFIGQVRNGGRIHLMYSARTPPLSSIRHELRKTLSGHRNARLAAFLLHMDKASIRVKWQVDGSFFAPNRHESIVLPRKNSTGMKVHSKYGSFKKSLTLSHILAQSGSHEDISFGAYIDKTSPVCATRPRAFFH